MKHLSFLYDISNKEYVKAKKKAKKSLYTAQLIQVFTALTKKKEIQNKFIS